MASPAADRHEPPDPYRWLEDATNPRTCSWLAEQAAVLDAATRQTDDPGWAELLARIDGAASGRLLSPPVEAGGLLFRHEYRPDGDVLAVHRADDKHPVLVEHGRGSRAGSRSGNRPPRAPWSPCSGIVTATRTAGCGWSPSTPGHAGRSWPTPPPSPLSPSSVTGCCTPPAPGWTRR